MILCSGCFDGLHSGHVAYLEGARKLAPGELLCVAIAPDSYIREKKAREPYWSQQERLRTVQALRVVDLAWIQIHDTAADLIDALRPTAFIKGEDYCPASDDPVPMTCRRLDIPIWLVYGSRRTHVSETR